MFKNYLKVALRNLLKQKGYSVINILGLAIGMTSCLLIFLYVVDELKFDRFHDKADSIYRLNWDFKSPNNEGLGSGTPPPLAAALVHELPEVKAVTRLYPVSDMIVRHGDKFFNEQNIVAADSNFFEFFSFKLLAGNPKTVLDKPNSVILTEKTAQKYFDDEPALGKILTIGDDNKKFWGTYSSIFRVTGVVENISVNSHFRFDFLTSISSQPQVAYFDWSWIWMQVVTYAMLDADALIPDLETKIMDIVATQAPPAFNRVGFSYDELIENGGRWNFVFQPLTDIYLGSVNIGSRLGTVGNRIYVVMLAVIAVFILFIACINFINLATARSANRAREVGVRKVLGAVKRNFIGQFLTESVIFSFLAILIALGLTEILLEQFNHLSGKALALNLMESLWLLPSLALITFIVGIAAGGYPALYLSKFQPVQVLKGKLTVGMKSQGLRNMLVVFQFAISIGLIICTLIVHKQMQFIREADVGFNKEGVLVISNENQRLGSHAETFRDRIKASPGVINATLSTGLPPLGTFQDYYKITRASDEQFELTSYLTDENFVQTLGLQVLAGRGFSKEFNESGSVLLNQSAVKNLGLDDPIGKTIYYPSGGEYEIVGVIKDFNFLTLQQPILPFALFHNSSNSYTIPSSNLAIRLQSNSLESALNHFEKEWQALAPATPFEYSFMGDNFEAQYRAEQRLGALFLIFAGLAVFIACLGLLGLASFTAGKRTKEIGIRKIVGASIPNLIFMLSKEFTRWVVVANIIAWPLAFYFMSGWLEDFAYKTEITWDIFLLAGGIALLISILTVIFQANKAALKNPVEALRYE